MHVFKASAQMAAQMAALIGALAMPAIAQAQETDPITAARLSAELFAVADAKGDALLMIAAARLRKSAPVATIDRAPERDGDAPSAETLEPPLTWEAMLEAAQELSYGDPQLEGLIEDVRAEASKGVQSGRVESYTSIRAGGTDTYRPLVFSGGTYADVYVEGSGVADLNLFVRDAKGRLVCSDTDISAIAYCGWQPNTSETFAVEVRNKGGAPTTYKLMTN